MKRYVLSSFRYLMFVTALVVTTLNTIACDYDSIEYRPFIEDGKEWLVVAATNEVFWTKKYYIAEDTTVNNQLCKKLMYHFVDYERDTTYTNLLYCIFEEDKKVGYVTTNG